MKMILGKEVILKYRFRIALITALLFCLFAAMVLLNPKYEAETVIMVDLKQGPTSADASRIDATQLVGLVRTNIDLLQSTPVLKSVVTDLGLDERLVLKSASGGSIEREKIVMAAVDMLRKSCLSIGSPPFTNIIAIRIKYKNAELAKDIANKLVENYIKWSVDFLHKEAHSVSKYLDKEVSIAKERLENSEEALKVFRAKNNVVDLPEEVRTYFQMLPEDFRSYYQLGHDAQMRLLEMEESLEREKLKGQYLVIQDAEAKILELEVELGRLRELYTESSSPVLRIKENIAQLNQKIEKLRKAADEEIADSKKAIAQKQDSLFTQRSGYSLNEKYLEKLKDVPEKERVLSGLMREVKINEELYRFLLQEQERARLLEMKETTENIRIVSLASLPLKPKGRLTGLFISAVMSLFLALSFVFVWELRKELLR